MDSHQPASVKALFMSSYLNAAFHTDRFVLHYVRPYNASGSHHSSALKREGPGGQEVCPRPQQAQRTQRSCWFSARGRHDNLMWFPMLSTPGRHATKRAVCIKGFVTVLAHRTVYVPAVTKNIVSYSCENHHLPCIQAFPNL